MVEGQDTISQMSRTYCDCIELWKEKQSKQIQLLWNKSFTLTFSEGDATSQRLTQQVERGQPVGLYYL